jgi:hypothetical protein
MRWRSIMFATLLLLAGGSVASAQEATEVRIRAVGGPEYTDIGSGWRFGLQSDVWMHGTGSSGFVGFGLRLATGFDRDENIGRRRVIDGEVFIAPAYDIGDFRIFASPAFGVSAMTQVDYWDGNSFQGDFLHFGVSVGVLFRWRRLEASLAGKGTYFIGQNPADTSLVAKPLFNGGWSYGLEIGLGYIAPL